MAKSNLAYNFNLNRKEKAYKTTEKTNHIGRIKKKKIAKVKPVFYIVLFIITSIILSFYITHIVKGFELAHKIDNAKYKHEFKIKAKMIPFDEVEQAGIPLHDFAQCLWHLAKKSA